MKKTVSILLSAVILCISVFGGAFSASALPKQQNFNDFKKASDISIYEQDDGAPVLGDVNNDGEITAVDALLALQYSVGILDFDYSQFTSANVDNNEQITANDALLILQYAVGLIEIFPRENPDHVASGKTLIVYFSWSSNTERLANVIREQTGGDILELIPTTPYSTDYTACTEVALTERDNNARPEISNLPESIGEYDNILIGYPIWWHTAPMIIGSFLESYDLTGINVYPFSQSASMDRSQFETSMNFVRDCAGNATVHDGLFARATNTSAISEYLSNNNLLK